MVCLIKEISDLVTFTNIVFPIEFKNHNLNWETRAINKSVLKRGEKRGKMIKM